MVRLYRKKGNNFRRKPLIAAPAVPSVVCKPPKPKLQGSRLERRALLYLKSYRFPEPVREYRFAPPRQWRFDLAYPDKKIAIELEGGVWVAGRHNRGQGMISDMTKYNTAALMGWKVLRYSTSNLRDMISDLRALI